MKLTIILMVVAILHVSASSSAQKITLSETNTPLNKVFEKISNQTGYDFIVSSENLKQAKPVTVSVQNEDLEKTLERIFATQPLGFVIQDKIIAISKKKIVNEFKASESSALILNINGTVTDSVGKPLRGATIQNNRNLDVRFTDENGKFSIPAEPGDVIEVSFIGFQTYYLNAKTNVLSLHIILRDVPSKLSEVSVVSTGYQTLPKERATGSFVLVDSGLLNRGNGINIINRLDGVTSGLLFNNNRQDPNSSILSIRGRSTLFASDKPLIVLDNFPYEGDINNINPNDIASITVLKDAAAASIWGVKAGNGVIVISSKKGKISAEPRVDFNASLTISEKPNLFYTPQLTPSEYIDLEKYLFAKGYYYRINDGFSAISPVLSALQKNAQGQLGKPETEAVLNSLRNSDVRNDINKFINRVPVNQQYQAAVSGGNEFNRYYFSAGWDKNLQNVNTKSYDRVTINANNTYSFLKNSLDWTTNILFSKSHSTQNTNTFNSATPYEMLKSSDGANLPVIKDLRQSYIDTAGNGKLLDWRYIPLDDNYANQNVGLTDYRLSNSLSFKILKYLKISGYYLFEKGITDLSQNNMADSYYTRNLINTYTQIDKSSGAISHIFPIGDILLNDNSNYTLNSGRFQLAFDKALGKNYQLNALAGYEVSEYKSSDNSVIQYGYDPATATNANQSINFANEYPQYFGYNTGRIPSGISSFGTIDRNRSYYANTSLSYKHRYIVSGSARRDESNLFGVNTNQKGVPLWSTGISWKVNEEPFYHSDALPFLSFRATFGFNGNTDKSTTAYLTAVSAAGQINSFNAPFSVITNPPNPALRWEKVAVTNFGIDFGSKNNIISGSVEYYIKSSTDLIANSPIAPQTGVVQYRGNYASMRTKGLDILLHLHLLNRIVQWNSMVLFNYSKNKITKYNAQIGTNEDIVQGNYLNPLVGYPLYSIFSYPSAKLDEQGNPRGYLQGNISNDYQAISTSTDRNNLIYNGSASPIYFGSIISNFSYNQIDFSFGVSYKFDYYFRKTTLNYSTLFGGFFKQADFSKRWQKPGDENLTSVPAMIYPNNDARDRFYTNSNTAVERADNIRLQDVRLGYMLDKNKIKGMPFKNLQFYVYANNLAILWRANHDGIDPDSPFGPPLPRSIAIGLKANL